MGLCYVVSTCHLAQDDTLYNSARDDNTDDIVRVANINVCRI